MIHKDPHELAGKTVKIKSGEFVDQDYRIEDWWDRVGGKSWTVMEGNPACLEYAMRSSAEQKPISDEVVYGKIGSFGKLMHISDLGEQV
jgi:hypothetical protein